MTELPDSHRAALTGLLAGPRCLDALDTEMKVRAAAVYDDLIRAGLVAGTDAHRGRIYHLTLAGIEVAEAALTASSRT